MEQLSSTHVVIQTTRSTLIQSFCTKLLIRCHHHHVPPNPFTLLDTPLLREPTRLPPLTLILYSDRTVRYRPQQILRSVLNYAVGIWFNPLRKSSNISSLIIFQNKCLRLIGGAFKATPSFLLESELFLLPLDLYFKFRTACFLSSIQTSSLKDFLDSTFSTISSYTSSLRKLLKKSSTISPNWKFTWLSQITTNQASSKKELQILFTKEWENQ